ncbi:universal stress protein [Microbacterium horticulturae]|uniref:Universal stress protein n=1 Tax=Microbacterium horticulturae TaxID=3028316 RepID=A0ABY8BVY7_9MICO|nr:universal stress protein [Microbacterium sp. KACC 23027]WEG08349.1 universal stress protein [Microbacterium sp. KACC 23027]
MSEKIVVGLSAAPVSERVVTWAEQHAKALGQSVELVTIVGGGVGAVGEDSIAQTAHEAAQQMLATHAARLKEAGVDVTVRVERGNPVAVLVEASEGATLLVIGSDSKGPGSGSVRGAHGIRISAAAKSPVVVVPDFDVSGRSGVLVGTDGSEVSAAAVRFAAIEAVRLGESLTALSVWTPMPIPGPLSGYPEPYLDDMQGVTAEILRGALASVREEHPDLEIVERVECGYPSTIITELAHDARLAVVGSHGRGAFARLLLGSISHEVLARLGTVTAIVR